MSQSLTPFALLLALLAPQVPATSHAGPPGNARRAQAARPQAKLAVQLTAKNAAAVPGETRTVEATLVTTNGQPVAGKLVRFTLSGPNGVNNLLMGSATTNAQGKAAFGWSVPELSQAAYTMTARFAGDNTTVAATDTANFAMIKGITQIVLSNLVWGALDAHGGGNYGVVFVEVKRKSDGKRLAKPITMTVNGQTWVVNNGSNPSTSVSIVLPSNTNHWNVKAQFAGDGANQATMAERSYTHN